MAFSQFAQSVFNNPQLSNYLQESGNVMRYNTQPDNSIYYGVQNPSTGQGVPTSQIPNKGSVINTQPTQTPPPSNDSGNGGQYGGYTNKNDWFRALGLGNIAPEGWNGPSAVNPMEEKMRNDINSGWDQYIGQLNEILNTGLPGQKQAQENIANTSYNSGVNNITSQKKSSEDQVNTQQAKNLKDIASNVENLFQSGNIFLGSRGAGDSSAANQYSYAVTKLGSKARGDVLSEVGQRLNQIKDLFDQGINQLESDKQMRMAQIADWFNNAQNSIRQQIGQAGQGRASDLANLSNQVYNRAITAMQQLQQEQANNRAALQSWAVSNSKNVQELVNNLKTVQQMPAFQGINGGMPSVTTEGNYIPTGFATSTSTQDRDIFGNIIRR